MRQSGVARSPADRFRFAMLAGKAAEATNATRSSPSCGAPGPETGHGRFVKAIASSNRPTKMILTGLIAN